MGQALPNAPDKYDRSNEQQARRTIENLISDLQGQMYALLTTAGTLRLTDGDITLANGANNDIAPGYSVYVRISGPSGSFTLTGFADGELGRYLIIRNTTAQQMTIANQSVGSAAANRIVTNSGADVVLPAASGATAVFEYDATLQRWVLLAATPYSTTGSFTTIELGSAGTTDTTISRASAGHIAVEGSNVLLASDTTIDLTTSGVLKTGTLEVGHATDTTLSRASAGVLAVEGVALLRAGQNLADVTTPATALSNIGGVASSTLGVTTLASGSLPAAATLTLSSISAAYSYLVLFISGWSQDTNTARLRIRIGTSAVDSTAASYVGNIISGTTVTNFTTNALASLVDGATQTIAQTGSAVVVIYGYQAGPHKQFSSRIIANTTESQCFGTYIGATTVIDTIEVSTSAAGSFDAGTYALYGYR
jgi:riboflavin synthase